MIGQISITKISKTTCYHFFAQKLKTTTYIQKIDKISILMVDIIIFGR